MGLAGRTIFAACLCLFSWRLFAPPLIGIANNGDFAKITAPLSLGPVSGWHGNRYRFVDRDYIHAAEFAWNSHYYSSEALVAWAADGLARVFQRGGRFDIRWMGILHVALLLAALAWLLAALRPLGGAVQLTAGAAAGLVLGDAAYLGYCNTFYADGAAVAGLFLTIAVLTDLAVRGVSRPRLAGLVAAALFLVTSKTQHAPLALPLALLAWGIVRRRAGRAIAAGIAAAAVLFIAISPLWYRGDALFSLVFYKIAPHSPDAAGDLAALGLHPWESRYIGWESYTPGAPTVNSDYDTDLARRVTMARLVRFYAAHPGRTAGILWSELRDSAPHIAAPSLGNYTTDSGRGPGAQASGYWTSFEGRVLERAPWLVPLWLASIVVFGLVRRSALSWICVGLAAMAALEFGVASLLDGLDTSRHLLLFHVLLESTYGFGAAAAVRAMRSARGWRPAACAWKPA